MLEEAGALRTWVLTELPAIWQSPGASSGLSGRFDAKSSALSAEEIQPHRIDYLTLRGPVQGNRGSVSRVDEGSYVPLVWTDCDIHVRLTGTVWQGSMRLRRRNPQTCMWQLSCSAPDAAA
jgi:hypothetical protein